MFLQNSGRNKAALRAVSCAFIALLLLGAVPGYPGQPVAAQDASAESVRFAVIGDYGTEGEDLQTVADMIHRWQPDLIITTGDNNYEKGAYETIDPQIGQYFHDYIYPYQGTYGAGADTNRFFPSLGNHDYVTDNAQPYLDYFTLPGNEHYYSFVWGPVEFFAVDSNPEQPDGIDQNSQQAQWLHDALAASTTPWQIVYFHHAPYSSGGYGPNATMQWPFAEWGADAVLSGHEHLYERLVVTGIPFFVNGVGGASRRQFAALYQDSKARFRSAYGAMLAEASSETLKFEFYSVEDGGTLIDAYQVSADGTVVAMDQPAAVMPTAETAPMPHEGASADDPAIWVNTADPAQSLVIGTDVGGGLGVYSLSGEELQYLEDGEIDNVDVRDGFLLGGELVSLVAASNRTAKTIAVYTVDPAARALRNVAGPDITPEMAYPYGLCLYHSASTGDFYAFVTDSKGNVEQWRLFDDGQGRVDGEMVREFEVGSRSEGCAADDEQGSLYLAEEEVGIWRYGAEPGSGDARVEVDNVGPDGHLIPAIEGLALYAAGDGTGYLIASSQDRSAFAVYDRTGDNAYLGSFQIVDGDGVDGVTDTTGIDVASAALGDAFPQGVFVAQDARNDEGNRNFKLVPWDQVPAALGLGTSGD